MLRLKKCFSYWEIFERELNGLKEKHLSTDKLFPISIVVAKLSNEGILDTSFHAEFKALLHFRKTEKQT